MARNNPRELVRAKMPSGGENNVARSYAERNNLKILGPAAAGRGGKLLPPKPKVTLPPAGGDEGRGTPPASIPSKPSGSDNPTGSGSAEATS